MCFSTLNKRMIISPAKLGLVWVSVFALYSCNPNSTERSIEPSLPAILSDASPSMVVSSQTLDIDTSMLVKQLVFEYVSQTETDFIELRAELLSLQKEIENLVDSPSSSALVNAQKSWSSAHRSYQQSSLHFYFASKIATLEQSNKLFELAYRMDHWPILAGYIDSVGGYAGGGIVHDVNVELSPASLKQQHGLFDSTEATLGFHVVEFLLWGEPSAESARRTFEDFVPVNELTEIQRESGMEISQVGNNRRREFLKLSSAILTEDFESSFAIWNQASANFLDSVEGQSSAALLNLLLDSATSMLTEELLTRSLYPLLNGELESALQSPYSQTSEITVAAQLQSVEQLLLETPTSDGITLDKILVSLSPVFEEFFYQNLDSNKACLILLYSSFGQGDRSLVSSTIEFEVVECINLLTNLIDQIEQIKLTLPLLPKPV